MLGTALKYEGAIIVDVGKYDDLENDVQEMWIILFGEWKITKIYCLLMN